MITPRRFNETALICLQGHVVTNSLEMHAALFKNSTFCEECGSQLIFHCPACKEPIKGQAYSEMTFSYSKGIDMWGKSLGSAHHTKSTKDGQFKRPAFCRKCGKNYPWTQMALEAAEEAIELMDELNNDDKHRFKENMKDIISETPRTTVAANIISRLLAKVAPGTGDIFRQAVSGITVEGVKQLLWP